MLEEEAGGIGMEPGCWSVERRFRVTEVFLAVLWVRYVCFILDGRIKR